MTYAEALRLAARVWGPAGDAEWRPRGPERARCVVGTKGAPPERAAYRVGPTWEEAFADASRATGEGPWSRSER